MWTFFVSFYPGMCQQCSHLSLLFYCYFIILCGKKKLSPSSLYVTHWSISRPQLGHLTVRLQYPVPVRCQRGQPVLMYYEKILRTGAPQCTGCLTPKMCMRSPTNRSFDKFLYGVSVPSAGLLWLCNVGPKRYTHINSTVSIFQSVSNPSNHPHSARFGSLFLKLGMHLHCDYQVIFI